jgi:hypothetical protein
LFQQITLKQKKVKKKKDKKLNEMRGLGRWLWALRSEGKLEFGLGKSFERS